MDHESLRQNLSAFIDGELLEKEREELEMHLKSCAECRTELESLRSASGAFRARAHREAPKALIDAVLDSQSQPSPAERRDSRLVFALAVLAFLCLFLVGGRRFRPILAGVFNNIRGLITGHPAENK